MLPHQHRLVAQNELVQLVPDVIHLVADGAVPVADLARHLGLLQLGKHARRLRLSVNARKEVHELGPYVCDGLLDFAFRGACIGHIHKLIVTESPPQLLKLLLEVLNSQRKGIAGHRTILLLIQPHVAAAEAVVHAHDLLEVAVWSHIGLARPILVVRGISLPRHLREVLSVLRLVGGGARAHPSRLLPLGGAHRHDAAASGPVRAHTWSL
mmetsp:Transcript_6856/g.19916  ORF Transcript_6856/g.19916 Transcript_6856/m.19916 type:complete len:211 (+) Transcript_6856:1294-1926(+)